MENTDKEVILNSEEEKEFKIEFIKVGKLEDKVLELNGTPPTMGDGDDF